LFLASGPPPAQRLLFFFLLFILFSFTILVSGHTFRTTSALLSLYHATVTAPSAPLHAYHLPLSNLLQSWPLFGIVISGTYLVFLLQQSMRDKQGTAGDRVDWLGGGMAALMCTGCLYALSSQAKDWIEDMGK